MHPNPVFHTATTRANLAFARDRGFGILAVNGAEGPLLSHVPFLLSDDLTSVDLHLVRSNPIARGLKEPCAAKLAVSGADSYISPDWYGIHDQVPTWNYVAVHLTGMLEPLPVDMLRDVIDRQSAHFETRLEPKTPWSTGKMSPDALDRLMRMILPFRLVIKSVDGTWKLNQNKPDEARQGAADHVAAYGIGSDPAILAALMRSV